METFFLHIYDTAAGKMIAACDAELLGERFEEGDRVLDVDPLFYEGEEVDFATIEAEMEEVHIGNFVGEHLIRALIKHGFIEESEVDTIDGVPFTNLYVIPA